MTLSLPFSGRALLVAVASMLVSGCITSSPAEPDGAQPEDFAARACDLPRPHLVRTWRGHLASRSGDVQILTKSPDLLGTYLPHSGPWPHLQEIPMLFYGPGHVPEAGSVDGPASLPDVSATVAEHLGFDFPAPDGVPLRAAVSEAPGPPRLVVVIVWDGVGRNVLEEHPGSWPVLRRLKGSGAWFERAVVGSSPTVTGVSHATLGTGAYPRNHGLVNHHFRLDGELLEMKESGSRGLLVPTLAEAWDEATGNRAEVGIIAKEPWHLGMIGLGGARPGGDLDLALINPLSGWALTEEQASMYRSVDYAASVPGDGFAIRRYDLEDGTANGRWHGDDEVLEDATITSAQTRLIERVITEEGFGADEVPDLLFVNYKAIDKWAHAATYHDPRVGLLLREFDRGLAILSRALDRHVGKGEWVMTLTSDHGSTPDPERTGAFQIDPAALRRDLQAAFDGDGDGRDVVQVIRVTEILLDRGELSENGFTVADVAGFLTGYTKADNAADPSVLAPEVRDEPAFAIAYPSEVLDDLPCADLLE